MARTKRAANSAIVLQLPSTPLVGQVAELVRPHSVMKTLHTLIILILFAFSTLATEIRVRNDSKVDFKNVRVGGKEYGDIKQGGITGYQTWKTAYRSSSVSLLTESKPLTFRPITYIGEKPLSARHFTFALTIKDGRLEIRTESDYTSYYDQQRLCVRNWCYETPAGRFGYQKIISYESTIGQSPIGTDRYFLFGPLGLVGIGTKGVMFRPKPLLGIIGLTCVCVVIVSWLVRRKRHGN